MLGQRPSGVGVSNGLRKIVAGHGLAVVALEIQRHARSKTVAANQGLHHAHHLGALVVDRRRVEIVDLLVLVGTHRVRHRASVFGELNLTQLAHVFNALDSPRSGAVRHVHAELLVAENRQAFFQTQLKPVAASDAVARPVVEVLVGHHAFNAREFTVGGSGRIRQHKLGVEDVQALVFHCSHVEVADRDDHETLQVQRQFEARFVPHHAGNQRVHRMFSFVQITAAHKHLQQMIFAGAGANVLFPRDQIGRHKGEQIAGFGERVVPLSKVPFATQTQRQIALF